jgi:hypothetical protein
LVSPVFNIIGWDDYQPCPTENKKYEAYWRKVTQGKIGYDLGSGDARMVILLALLNPSMEWYGVEVQLIPHDEGMELLNVVQTMVKCNVTLVNSCVSTFEPPAHHLGRPEFDVRYFLNNFLFNKFFLTQGKYKNANLAGVLNLVLGNTFPPGKYVTSGALYSHTKHRLRVQGGDFDIVHVRDAQNLPMESTFNTSGLTLFQYEARVTGLHIKNKKRQREEEEKRGAEEKQAKHLADALASVA